MQSIQSRKECLEIQRKLQSCIFDSLAGQRICDTDLKFCSGYNQSYGTEGYWVEVGYSQWINEALEDLGYNYAKYRVKTKIVEFPQYPDHHEFRNLSERQNSIIETFDITEVYEAPLDEEER